MIEIQRANAYDLEVASVHLDPSFQHAAHFDGGRFGSSVLLLDPFLHGIRVSGKLRMGRFHPQRLNQEDKKNHY